jgi:hypothetical protein
MPQAAHAVELVMRQQEPKRVRVRGRSVLLAVHDRHVFSTVAHGAEEFGDPIFLHGFFHGVFHGVFHGPTPMEMPSPGAGVVPYMHQAG